MGRFTHYLQFEIQAFIAKQVNSIIIFLYIDNVDLAGRLLATCSKIFLNYFKSCIISLVGVHSGCSILFWLLEHTLLLPLTQFVLMSQVVFMVHPEYTQQQHSKDWSGTRPRFVILFISKDTIQEASQY